MRARKWAREKVKILRQTIRRGGRDWKRWIKREEEDTQLTSFDSSSNLAIVSRSAARNISSRGRESPIPVWVVPPITERRKDQLPWYEFIWRLETEDRGRFNRELSGDKRIRNRIPDKWMPSTIKKDGDKSGQRRGLQGKEMDGVIESNHQMRMNKNESRKRDGDGRNRQERSHLNSARTDMNV